MVIFAVEHRGDQWTNLGQVLCHRHNGSRMSHNTSIFYLFWWRVQSTVWILISSFSTPPSSLYVYWKRFSEPTCLTSLTQREAEKASSSSSSFFFSPGAIKVTLIHLSGDEKAWIMCRGVMQSNWVMKDHCSSPHPPFDIVIISNM